MVVVVALFHCLLLLPRLKVAATPCDLESSLRVVVHELPSFLFAVHPAATGRSSIRQKTEGTSGTTRNLPY